MTDYATHDTPQVSVCIATYNRLRYLPETLASVGRQTFTDYEIVIVDDGSTDGTGDWVRANAPTARYFWQSNHGHPHAMDRLIELARGRYISFLDSDDWLTDDALERLVAATHGREDLLIYGPYWRIDQNGKVIGRDKRRLHSGFITAELFADILVHPNGSLFPRQILLTAGGLNPSWRTCYDYDLFLRLSLQHRFVALPDPTFYRRRHGTNLSQNTASNAKIELQVLENFYFREGGQSVIPRVVAMRRLARQAYRVAHHLTALGNATGAGAFVRRSLNYRWTFRALWLWSWLAARPARKLTP